MKKRIIKYSLLTICGALLFAAVNQAETIRRGYYAIGGEGAFILLPVLWWAIETTAKDASHDIKNYINGGNDNENSFSND